MHEVILGEEERKMVKKKCEICSSLLVIVVYKINVSANVTCLINH